MRDISLEEEQAIKERCRESNKGRFEHGTTIYTCPICQKNFCISDTSEWAYKRRTRSRRKNEAILYICTYGCTRTYDKIFEK